MKSALVTIGGYQGMLQLYRHQAPRILKETFGLWPSWSYRRTSGDRPRRVAELMSIQVRHSNISTHHIVPSDTINRATILVLK